MTRDGHGPFTYPVGAIMEANSMLLTVVLVLVGIAALVFILGGFRRRP